MTTHLFCVESGVGSFFLTGEYQEGPRPRQPVLVAGQFQER